MCIRDSINAEYGGEDEITEERKDDEEQTPDEAVVSAEVDELGEGEEEAEVATEEAETNDDRLPVTASKRKRKQNSGAALTQRGNQKHINGSLRKKTRKN
eukprot:TRINITY_DN3058_c0_g2_i2.p1 TRINITY_DN3058_c0_g2~~TRINITY_DN3058_c0_g2_i2.p1  ORF type:complete len:100 (+),score=40.00 TRINITY_DN3058_c0_g2_i2:1-300(+)